MRTTYPLLLKCLSYTGEGRCGFQTTGAKHVATSYMSLLPLEEFGWNNDGGKLTVKWESDQNIQSVRSRVAFLTHGCNCKTGCGTKRCKCVKAEHPCGPGCSCTKHKECQNVPTTCKHVML